MKISTNRKTKIYQAGDEVTAQIDETKDSNGNLGFKFFIVENGVMTNSFFYHSIGAYEGKGSYYFDLLLNNLNVPEGLEIDEKWFIGKRVRVILGDYTNTAGKTYLNIASYVKQTGEKEELRKIEPFINGSDLTADIPFETEKKLPPKKSATKKTPGMDTGVARPDFMALIQEE